MVSGDINPSTLLAQSEFPVLSEDPLGEDQKPDTKKETVEPVTNKLPIWGQKVREMGFDLPLPFGAGANLVLMDQGIDIRNVKVGIGDPIFEIDDIGLSDARARDTAITLRLDMWLLPFANIYGIFGYHRRRNGTRPGYQPNHEQSSDTRTSCDLRAGKNYRFKYSL